MFHIIAIVIFYFRLSLRVKRKHRKQLTGPAQGSRQNSGAFVYLRSMRFSLEVRAVPHAREVSWATL